MKTSILLAWLVLTVATLPAQAQAPVSKTTKPAATTSKPTATAKPAAGSTTVRPSTVTKPAPTATPAATKPVDEAKPAKTTALVTEKMETPKPATDALKVKVEANPVTKRLTVRTNTSSPVRVEVNDDEGRPVMTKDMIVGDQDAVLDVSRLPAGYYIVNCTTGERRGMRRIMIGQ